MLSQDDQSRFGQIERDLMADDPRFLDRMRRVCWLHRWSWSFWAVLALVCVPVAGLIGGLELLITVSVGLATAFTVIWWMPRHVA